MPEDEGTREDHSYVVNISNTNPGTAKRRLPVFIKENVGPIVSEWEGFARTLTPSAHGMTPNALRDHIHQILAFVVSDMDSYQSPSEQTLKSHGDKT